jgi:glucan biosynthesis protein C
MAGYTIPIVQFPTPGYFPQYISLFVVGILAYRRNWLMSFRDSAGWTGLAVAMVAPFVLLVMIVLNGEAPITTFGGGWQWQAFSYALWEAIFCVSISIGLLIFFRKFFNRQGALGKFLSAHAYTVYIIHAPVIVGLAYVLQGAHLHQLLKFVIVVLTTITLCFVAAYLMRKLPHVDRVL